MIKLKRCCRTCVNLSPTTYEDVYYDYEENGIWEKYPCNCDYVNYNDDVDSITDCEHYKPIDESCLYEKPFNLVDFLEQNVSSVGFVKGENNYFLSYCSNSKKLYLECFISNVAKFVSAFNSLPVVYLDSGDFNAVVDKLNEKKITPSQLKKAYKKLGWI